jgi:hypothetical protein
MRSPYASINAALRSLFSLSAGLGELCRGESGVVLRTPNTTREVVRAMLRGVLVWQCRIGLGYEE